MKKRILLLSHDNKIGDAIVMTGLFKPLRAHWPDCEIGILCGNSNLALYRYHPDVKWRHVSFSRNVFTRMWASLKARWIGYDMVVHFGLDLENLSTQLVLNIVNAKQRFLFAPNPVKPLFNDVVMEGNWYTHQNSPHFSARHLRFLKELGVAVDKYEYNIPLETFPPHIKQVSNNLLIVINSQGSRPNRSVSSDWLYELVINIINGHKNVRVQLLSANKRHEAQLKTTFVNLRDYVSVTKSESSVLSSLSAIRAADVLISPDTYAVHAASAWNIPTIALYDPNGATEDLWAPLSDTYFQIIAPTKKIVQDIPIIEVINALNHVLSSPRTRERLYLNSTIRN